MTDATGPRTMVGDCRISYIEGTSAHATNVEQEYFDFGADIRVEPPMGDEVDGFFNVVPPL